MTRIFILDISEFNSIVEPVIDQYVRTVMPLMTPQDNLRLIVNNLKNNLISHLLEEMYFTSVINFNRKNNGIDEIRNILNREDLNYERLFRIGLFDFGITTFSDFVKIKIIKNVLIVTKETNDKQN